MAVDDVPGRVVNGGSDMHLQLIHRRLGLAQHAVSLLNLTVLLGIEVTADLICKTSLINML